MRINDDLTVPVLVNSQDLPWVPSPSPGVERRMLFRIGGEIARATSIVRYAPGSAFPRHTHSGGEEIFVLEGVFQDEHGDYPAGTYFRNPPGTSHMPAAADGCTIFVRLWQYRLGDQAQIVRRTSDGTPEVAPRSGAKSALILFDDGQEQVRLEDFAPGAKIALDNPRGLEFVVVAGSMTIDGELLAEQAWGRLPSPVAFMGSAGPDGVRLWIKEAPLLLPDALVLPAA